MATKVEELRARMLGNDPCYDMDDEGNMIQKGTVPHCIGIKAEELDSLIAAAREEGRAEERERIRGLSLIPPPPMRREYMSSISQPSRPAPKEEGK